MNLIKTAFKWMLIVALTLVGITYLVWIPSPQEPAYTMVKTWGSKGDILGQFNEPTGIVVSDTEVFVSDSRNHRIQVFDFDGTPLRQFGENILKRPMNLTIFNK